MSLIKTDFREANEQIFKYFAKDTPLLVSEKDGRVNAMVIGWGGLGTLWKWPVVTVYVRPTRFSFDYMNESEHFSLCVLSDEYKEAKKICGSLSGRDIDKVSTCGFDIAHAEDGTPYIAQSESVILARKLYWQDMDNTHFLDGDIEGMYKENDYHRIYVAEVTGILKK